MDERAMVMFTRMFTGRRGHKRSFMVIMGRCRTTMAAVLLCDVTDAQNNVSWNIKSIIIRGEHHGESCD